MNQGFLATPKIYMSDMKDHPKVIFPKRWIAQAINSFNLRWTQINDFNNPETVAQDEKLSFVYIYNIMYI